jgi:hypothetical protein
MARRLGYGPLLFAVLGVLAGMASASQVTLADSSQAVTFTGTSTGLMLRPAL